MMLRVTCNLFHSIISPKYKKSLKSKKFIKIQNKYAKKNNNNNMTDLNYFSSQTIIQVSERAQHE